MSDVDVQEATVLREELNWAWLAGFVDGEGSIGISKERDKRKGKDYYVLRANLQIVNTKREPIFWIRSFIGEGDCRKVLLRKRNHKDNYRYVLRRQRKLQEVLLRVLPYLRVKERQAEIVIAFIQGRLTSKSRGWFKPLTESQRHDHILIQKLNARGKPHGELREFIN